MSELSLKTALITGASSGLGEVFARQLAAQGVDLVLVARREDRLAHLAAELRQAHSIQAEILAADLAQPEGQEAVEARITRLPALDLLINNAGFGTTGRFDHVEASKVAAMVQVHDLASVRFCRAAAPSMVSRRQGGIINVASVAAFLPLSGSIVYSASKAMLVTFSEGLAMELGRSGVRVQALCPGFTYTGFHDTPEYTGFRRGSLPGFMWAQAGPVVAASLRAIQGGRPVVLVPGWINRFVVYWSRNSLTRPIAKAVAMRMR